MADYELLPKMAIVDADMMMNAPRGLTAASDIDAVTHALEAYASQVLSGRQLTKNLFPFLIIYRDFRSNRNQLTVFNRIDDVTELLKIFIVVGCQENCFSLGF